MRSPGAYYDQEAGHFYLYYRVRVEKANGRGIEFRIARGTDGIVFEDVWTCRKTEIGSVSIEAEASSGCRTASGPSPTASVMKATTAGKSE